MSRRGAVALLLSLFRVALCIFQGALHGVFTAAFEGVAHSSVYCVCLAWYGYIVAAGTRKVKWFFAIFHGSAFYTSARVYSCANCYTCDSTHTRTRTRREGNGCKWLYNAF